MVTSLRRTDTSVPQLPGCCSHCPNAVAGQPTPPLETRGHSQVSLAQPLVGSLRLFFWVLVFTRFCCVLPDAGKDWRQGEKWMTEDKMVGWHHFTRKEVGQWLLGRESMGSSPQMHYVTRPWLGCQGNLLDWELSSSFIDEVKEVKLPRSIVYTVKELEEIAWLQSPNSLPCNIWWIWSKKTAHHWNVFFSKFIAVSLLLLLFTLSVGSHSLWPHGL